MTVRIDVSAARRSAGWSLREKVARALWACATPLFRLSPRPMWGWRRMLLRAFGAQIGEDVHIYPTSRITIPWHLHIEEGAAVGDRVILYALGRIIIGARATISQNAHLCAGTHDRHDPARPLIRAPITIAADAWICADAFVGPGVTVGPDAILAARAVAMRDLPAGHVGRGNPMQVRAAR